MLSARCLGSCLAVVSLVAVGPAPALGSTVVRGDRDANAPLEIDPTDDPDVREISAFQPSRVAWIQEMPVTKRVDRVTVGDLARRGTCGAGQGFDFSLSEHPGGRWREESFTKRALEAVPLPASPGRVTFRIPPMTLRAGRTYSVTIQNTSSGCEAVDMRTWAHNSPEINGGSARCQLARDSDTYTTPYRMWHRQGEPDGVACPPYGSIPAGFDASMPTGWLRVARGGNYADSYISYGSRSRPNPPCSSYRGDGVRPVEWTGHSDDDVCAYTNFTGLDATATDGWYWGTPWWSARDGAPRDSYVRFDPIDYDALLAAHSPTLRYDADDDFHAISPGAATDFFDGSGDPDELEESNQLKDAADGFATANSSIAGGYGFDVLSLGYLAREYTGLSTRAGTQARPDDFISERGDGKDEFGFFTSDGYASDAAEMESRAGYANRTYGRVAHGADGSLWLQYWLYYYFDSQGTLGASVHEGDWEMVQVRLKDDLTPDLAAYSQHAIGERCSWGAIESDQGHPRVYVAQASHASYSRAGHYDDPSPDDDAQGDGAQMAPAVEQIRSEQPSWVAWPGRWGDSSPNSPVGPRYQAGDKWSDPSAWAAGLAPCDVG